MNTNKISEEEKLTKDPITDTPSHKESRITVPNIKFTDVFEEYNFYKNKEVNAQSERRITVRNFYSYATNKNYSRGYLPLIIRIICISLCLSVNALIPVVILTTHALIVSSIFMWILFSKDLDIQKEWRTVVYFSYLKGVFYTFLPWKHLLSWSSATNAILLVEDTIFAAVWAMDGYERLTDESEMNPFEEKLIVLCVICILDIGVRIYSYTNKEDTVTLLKVQSEL